MPFRFDKYNYRTRDWTHILHVFKQKILIKRCITVALREFIVDTVNMTIHATAAAGLDTSLRRSTFLSVDCSTQSTCRCKRRRAAWVLAYLVFHVFVFFQEYNIRYYVSIDITCSRLGINRVWSRILLLIVVSWTRKTSFTLFPSCTSWWFGLLRQVLLSPCLVTGYSPPFFFVRRRPSIPSTIVRYVPSLIWGSTIIIVYRKRSPPRVGSVALKVQ